MSRRAAAGLLLVLLAALAVRGVGLDWGFPDIHEEATPVREAVEYWGEPGGSFDVNPHFFKYPSLTLNLQFAIQLIWYFALSLGGSVASLNDFRQLLAQDLTSAVLLGRWVQAILGALLVLPVFFLGRRLAGPAAGWVGVLVVALLPMAILESRLVSPDMALALFTAAALVTATRLAGSGERRDYLWTGLWIGLAASAKYPGALVLVSLLAAHTLQVARDRSGPLGWLGSSLLWQSLVTAAVVFAATSPYVLLDPGTALQDILFERRHMALGHLGREEGRAWGFYFGHAIPVGWTIPVAVAAAVGSLSLLMRRETRGTWIPAAAFVFLMLVVLGSWRMAAPRYLLPLVPVIAAWAGVGVAEVSRRVGRSGLRAGVASLLTLAVLAVPAVSAFRDLGGRGRVDTRAAALAWIESHVQEGQSLLVERYGPEPDRSRFTVLYLPFHGVTPHIYDPAYSPVLYATFDYVVLSAGVHARYLAAPREYPAQVQFYAAVERAFEEVAHFSPGEFTGPEIRVLRRRDDVPLRDLSGIPQTFFTDLAGNRPLAEYFSALGVSLCGQGHDALGLRMLQAAVDMDGENPVTWGNLGSAQLGAGRFEAALLAYRRARSLAPGDPRAAYNLATLYQRMGEPRQAADAYQEALGIDAAFEPSYMGLARVLIEDDRYGKARYVLEEFLRRFPRSPDRPRAESVLAELATMGPGKP